MECTKTVAEFVASTRYEDLPSAAVDAAKAAVLDSVGVALAGSREAAVRIAAELARAEATVPEAAVFGQGFRSSAQMAAFVNGIAAHALDYDASFTMGGQPMAGLAPTVFPLAEAVGANGRQLLEAYVVGYEVTGKLTVAVLSQSNSSAWHSPATFGSLGCTAAAARLLGLDVDQVRAALGIATSMASGVVWNFGTMSKPLHAGLAARNGVMAAKLAQGGFTANASVLEGAEGFLESFGQGGYKLDPLAEIGKTLEIESGVKYKAYPCGGLTHTAIDAALALRHEHQLATDMIERVEVGTTEFVARRIIYRIPETELQGKFSMPYVIARAVIDGALTPDTFSDEAIHDSAVLALAEKVHMQVDPEFKASARTGQPCKMTIHLRDGRSLFRRVDYPKGTPESPFGPGELRGKFTSCAHRVLTEQATDELAKLLDNLESVENIASVGELLMGAPRSS